MTRMKKLHCSADASTRGNLCIHHDFVGFLKGCPMRANLAAVCITLLVSFFLPVFGQDSLEDLLDHHKVSSISTNERSLVSANHALQDSPSVEELKDTGDWRNGMAGLFKVRRSPGVRAVFALIYVLVFVVSSGPVGMIGRDIGTETGPMVGVIAVCLVATLGYIVFWGVPQQPPQWWLLAGNVFAYLVDSLISSALIAKNF